MKKFLPKLKNNPQGFTLVELLVVITIIALLSTIGFVSFTSAQTQAKNAKRRADIDAIAKAYESNASTNVGGNSVYVALANGQFASGAIPTPPEGGNYTCVSGPSGGCSTASTSTFKVCAVLGTPSSGTSCTDNVAGACYCKSSAIVAAGSNAAGSCTPAFVQVLANKCKVVATPSLPTQDIYIQTCPSSGITGGDCGANATNYTSGGAINYYISSSQALGSPTGTISIYGTTAAVGTLFAKTISWHD